MITAKAPGKLYIAGEYAVVENGYPAILVALNQFVTCSIKVSPADTGRIISEQYHENSLLWRRQGDKMVVDQRDNPFAYILSAISVTEEYARSLDRQLQIYDIYIDSQLDSANGKKYGLGSSAAVTVATVKALCLFYDLPVDKDKLFKLAAIAHFAVQGNGSLGDVAASVYGGWIAYLPWPDLKIESLTAPANLQLLIGWTGSPASTSRLVDKISLFKARQQDKYHHFLEESKACIQRMIEGFHQADLDVIKREIRKNRELLKNLGANSGVQIETPILHELCRIAEDFGGAAKTSGAGGGDCGIVAIDGHADLDGLLAAWQTKKIEQLPLAVHFVNSIRRYKLKIK